MAVTVADINKLRQATQAGMMDCKKALEEANGDFDAAVDILRKKGAAKAAKRADRDAGEGLTFAKVVDGNVGVILSVNCETDFVAKNADFGQLVNTIVDIACDKKPADADALRACAFDADNSVADRLAMASGSIGEKIEIGAYHLLEAELVVGYNHPGNQVASVVGLNKAGNDEAGKHVAMQIAAMAPVAVDEDGVADDVKERELKLGREKAIEEGKPEQIVDKIAQGNLKKFMKENTLVNQAFIMDNKKTVRDYLKSVDGELAVTNFHRIALN